MQEIITVKEENILFIHFISFINLIQLLLTGLPEMIILGTHKINCSFKTIYSLIFSQSVDLNFLLASI